MHILLVDDDVALCALLQRFLTVDGFDVDCAHDGEEGLRQARAGNYDLLVLDITMPKKHGMDVLRELRQTSELPVLMMTARGEAMDRILGLELGADDYLPKPCNPRELAARMRAILRRSVPVRQATAHHIGALTWNPETRTVQCDSHPMDLTTTEYAILTTLMQHVDTVVSKEDLSQAALGKTFEPFDRSLDVHIGHIRKKLPCNVQEMPKIQTVRAVGWMLVRA